MRGRKLVEALIGRPLQEQSRRQPTPEQIAKRRRAARARAASASVTGSGAGGSYPTGKGAAGSVRAELEQAWNDR